jgi:pilus assembly protein FimV
MGEDLTPGHPLFAHHDDAPGDDETQVRPAFDIDHYGEELQDDETAFAPLAPPAPASPKKVSEYNFNFQLTPTPAPGQAEAPVAPYTEQWSNDGFDESAPAAPESLMPESTRDTFESADDAVDQGADEPVSSWKFETEEETHPTESLSSENGAELGEFSDDPVDTKLDLARAYMDMGDADGARAMLDEVLREGTQMQRDVAQRLADSLG